MTTRLRRASWLLLAVATGCAGGREQVDPPQPPAAVDLTGIGPEVVIPGSMLILSGSGFVDSAVYSVQLQGTVDSRPLDLTSPLKILGADRASLAVTEELFTQMGEGMLRAKLTIIARNEVGESRGQPFDASLQLVRHLTPKLTSVAGGVVYLNSKVTVEGDGFLIANTEGQTRAEIKGCFLPDGSSGVCATVGKPVSIRLIVQTDTDTSRRRGTFEFSPSIVGLSPGKLDGTVTLFNIQVDAQARSSATLPVSFQLGLSRVGNVDQKTVSLGQYLDIRGVGFVGGVPGTAEASKGSMLIHFEGTFTPKGGSPAQVKFDLVPGYKSGTWVRYVIEDGKGIGAVVELRTASGALSGSWTPTVYWEKASVQGQTSTASLQIGYIKQVIWIRYQDTWSDSLRLFGLTAGDVLIRRRILEVFRRDYAGINIEFREVEPQDFKLYGKLDISGKDPNGLGLLGYDNTPGKDVDNQRLYDWVGGVNALTQQDGYPGYGGVFLESLLGFSEHPPTGVTKSPLHNPLFDTIFDVFRPDRGRPLTVAEVAAAPELTSAADCPADGDRMLQAACAMRILGTVVGSTATHELGHSFGLAAPYGAPTEYHNPGDLPNRLMEAGGDRPFEERAEIYGQGPAVFCDDEYTYLKKILPLDPPADPAVTRPSCE
jgi:hypothetical protein